VIRAEVETMVKRLPWRNTPTHESLVMSEMITQLCDQYRVRRARPTEIQL
jgi:hypothetical protein